MPTNLQPNTAEQSFLSRTEVPPALATIVRWLVGYTIEEVDRELILSSLAHYCGNRTWTANVLGISIRTLRNKINQYAAQGVAVVGPRNAQEFPQCPALLHQHPNSNSEQRGSVQDCPS